MDEHTPSEATQASIELAPEMQAILAGYAEQARRDAMTDERAWRYWITGIACAGIAVVFAGILAYVLLTRRPVEAFVQVVQVNEGKVLPLGVPIDLLAYEPDDGLYLDMIGEWIRAVEWRGTEKELAQDRWAWAYYHTCGEARRVLQQKEEQEKPFLLGKRQVAITLESITRTPAPKSYHATWEAWITEQHQPPVSQRWDGTFTVGRLRPKDMAHALRNRLGLCVASFDISKVGSSK